MSRVRAKTCRRPIRSASSPPTLAPMRHPDEADRADPRQLASGARAHCAASAAMTNEMSPTSIASSAQPMPGPDEQPAGARG